MVREKVLSQDGWGSRVAHQDLGVDPLMGRILGLVKKIPSLCLIRSRVPSPARHPPVWAVAEWAAIAGPLVMGGQGSGGFSTGTCWFRDLLNHQWVVCALSASPRQCRWGWLYPPRSSFFYVVGPDCHRKKQENRLKEREDPILIFSLLKYKMDALFGLPVGDGFLLF
jgi:hypothetical protein